MHCWFCESPLRGAGPGEIFLPVRGLPGLQRGSPGLHAAEWTGTGEVAADAGSWIARPEPSGSGLLRPGDDAAAVRHVVESCVGNAEAFRLFPTEHLDGWNADLVRLQLVAAPLGYDDAPE